MPSATDYTAWNHDDYKTVYDYKEATRKIAKEGIPVQTRALDLDISKSLAERDTVYRHLVNILHGGDGIAIDSNRSGGVSIRVPEMGQLLKRIENAEMMARSAQAMVQVVNDENLELREQIKDLMEEVFEQ